MKKMVILLCCVAIFFTMVACADGVGVDEITGSETNITSEKTESAGEATGIIEEVVSADTEPVTEEVSEAIVDNTDNTLEITGEVVSESEVLEDSPITLMDTILFAQRSVNVRSGPGTDYEKLGTLSTNQEVTVTGRDNESGWYQIEYNGSTAFVSDSYLGEGKVVVSAPVSNTGNAGNNSAGTSNVNNANAVNSGNTQAGNATAQENSSNGSSDWFTGEDMENALQFGQQFGMY